MVVSPEMRSASSTPSAGARPSNNFSVPFVCEVEADFEINHCLAHHAKTKMPRLDNTGVHRTNGNFVYAFTPYRKKGKRCAVVFKLLR